MGQAGSCPLALGQYNIGSTEGLQSADEAFQVAFRLNPDLTLAHNFYTHVQVDQGRTLEALIRLLKRARQRRSDAELFAGLEHVCRYCGLLQSALAAHREARRLDPQISTSVQRGPYLFHARGLSAGTGDVRDWLRL